MIHQDAPVPYPIAQRLKALGWPQDGLQHRYYQWPEGGHYLSSAPQTLMLGAEYPAAPTVFAVLTSEWLEQKEWEWRREYHNGYIEYTAWCERAAGTTCKSLDALELLEKILDVMEAEAQ